MHPQPFIQSPLGTEIGVCLVQSSVREKTGGQGGKRDTLTPVDSVCCILPRVQFPARRILSTEAFPAHHFFSLREQFPPRRLPDWRVKLQAPASSRKRGITFLHFHLIKSLIDILGPILRFSKSRHFPASSREQETIFLHLQVCKSLIGLLDTALRLLYLILYIPAFGKMQEIVLLHFREVAKLLIGVLNPTRRLRNSRHFPAPFRNQEIQIVRLGQCLRSLKLITVLLSRT